MCVSARSCFLMFYEFFNRRDLSAIETERNAVFIQNTLPEVQFRDSLFAAEISVNPCETATKGTKKLLAIVSTFASREFVLVEVVIVPQTE